MALGFGPNRSFGVLLGVRFLGAPKWADGIQGEAVVVLSRAFSRCRRIPTVFFHVGAGLR